MIVEIPLGVGASFPQARDAYVGPGHANERRCLQCVRAEQRANGAILPAIPCKGDAGRHFKNELLDVHACGAVDLNLPRDEDNLTCLRLAQGVE